MLTISRIYHRIDYMFLESGIFPHFFSPIFSFSFISRGSKYKDMFIENKKNTIQCSQYLWKIKTRSRAYWGEKKTKYDDKFGFYQEFSVWIILKFDFNLFTLTILHC